MRLYMDIFLEHLIKKENNTSIIHYNLKLCMFCIMCTFFFTEAYFGGCGERNARWITF